MNLRNGQITVGELLQNQQARQLLARSFPQLMGSPMLARARGMQLGQVLGLARRYVAPPVINNLLMQLKEI